MAHSRRHRVSKRAPSVAFGDSSPGNGGAESSSFQFPSPAKTGEVPAKRAEGVLG